MDACSISYSAPEDYIHMSANLTLTNTSQTQVTIPIVGDALLERNETFRAEISLVRTEDSNCVILQPDTVDITILDDDSELRIADFCIKLYPPLSVAVIGFVPVDYLVTEGTDSSVSITVELISGQLGRDVEVVLNTHSDGFATSESCMC